MSKNCIVIIRELKFYTKHGTSKQVFKQKRFAFLDVFKEAFCKRRHKHKDQIHRIKNKAAGI